MKQLDPNIEVIWGTSTDNELGKDVKVIILAAAMAHEMEVESVPSTHTPQDEDYYRTLMQQLYAAPKTDFRTVIQGELPFVEDEPTENAPIDADNHEPAESDDSEPVDDSDPENPDESGTGNPPKPTFLQKAINWLIKLTDDQV